MYNQARPRAHRRRGEGCWDSGRARVDPEIGRWSLIRTFFCKTGPSDDKLRPLDDKTQPSGVKSVPTGFSLWPPYTKLESPALSRKPPDFKRVPLDWKTLPPTDKPSLRASVSVLRALKPASGTEKPFTGTGFHTPARHYPLPKTREIKTRPIHVRLSPSYSGNLPTVDHVFRFRSRLLAGRSGKTVGRRWLSGRVTKPPRL